MVNVIVEQRGEQIVGERDGAEVAGEVEVDVLHWHHLRVAAAGRATFHAEHGPQRRLAQTDDGFFADVVQRIAQAHRRRRLAFAGRGG